jgi:hypothetical protein
MKTLTAEEYEMLLRRCELSWQQCDESCGITRIPVAYDASPVHSRLTLTELVQRGVLNRFICGQMPNAAHFYTNERGRVAMTLYQLTKQLADLKLDGETK